MIIQVKVGKVKFYQILSEKGKNLGRYLNLKDAKERLRQIEYFKHKGK
jgi:hypothetical protein